MKRIIGVSLAALSTAVVSTCPLLASTQAEAAVAPRDASYGVSTTSINFAGPATASLVIAGKTYKFKNGTCMSIKVSGITVDVSLGSVVQDKNGAQAKGNGNKPSFRIDLSPHPPDIIETVYYGGKELVDSGSITAKGNVVKSGSSKGTFSSGTSLNGSSVPFTGSWNCHGKFEKH